MKVLLVALLDGLRVVVLRPPRGTRLTASASLFIALIGVYVAVTFGLALIGTPPPSQFNAGGISTLLADSLLALIAGWLLVVFAQRRDIVWGVAAIVLAATIMNALVVQWPLTHASDALLERGHALPAVVLELLSHLWWLLVLIAFANRLSPHSVVRALAAALLAYAISTGTSWWLPQTPLLATLGSSPTLADNSDSTANDASPNPPNDVQTDAESTPAFDAEQVMFDQPALLDVALARLKLQTPGKVDLYVVAFAGDGEEDVFRNEVEYVEQLFAQHFDADGRVLVLENNAASVSTRPLATWTNLHRSLDAIAKKMDPAEDIVLIYLTTHGSQDHQLLVDLDPLPLNQIEPTDMADALKTTPPMRWKVIIVNACYSGGFVDALRDDSTMVMTSARADRTSFGCGAESDITYFGRAFLVDALNKTTSLHEAFNLAKQSVLAWETAEHEEHSEPQIATSPAIEAQLAAWRRQLPEARSAVPFAPSPTSAGD